MCVQAIFVYIKVTGTILVVSRQSTVRRRVEGV